MALLKASWKRTVKVQPYETLTFELGIEAEGEGSAQQVALMAQQLETQGNQLIVEALTALAKPAPPENPW